MSKDQAIGILILVASIVVAGFYAWWTLLTPVDWVWFGMVARWWALAIPMLIAVLAILGVLGWIGYTMATTPPPMPIKTSEETREEGSAEGAS